MSHEGFPLRHRGVHVPDHLRRLDEIATSVSPRTRRGVSAAAATSPLRREQSPNPRNDPDFAAFFRNLTVWVDDALSNATAHAGYDKVHLYVAVLRGFVDQVVPLPPLQHVVGEIQAYVAYLSCPPEPAIETHNQPHRPSQPSRSAALMGVVSPRQVVLSKGVLSPRVIRAMAKDAANEASLSSPRITQNRPKKIIQLSDHEEAILEVALYYMETLTQLTYASKQPVSKKAALARAQPTLTHQWLLFPMEKRAHLLKKIKTKIAKNTLFPCSPTLSASAPSTPATSAGPRAASGGVQSATSPTIHSLDLPSYFSLLVLCLQETTRRISVFSAELAVFWWGVVVQDAVHTIEALLEQVLMRQQRAHDELERLKSSRNNVHDAIAHCEREIQRLQAQNMRSLAVWELEKAEMTMLEKEEAWHGHCKSLILKSLLALQDEVNQVTWLQVGTSGHSVEATIASNDIEEGDTHQFVTTPENTEPVPVKYQRLPVGAALLHSRLRSRVVYVTHLIVLCRSFMHLHEKRGLREVMEATSTNPRWSDPPSPSNLQSQSTALDGFDSHSAAPASSHTNPMERISLNELLTLKDINDVLRAIEELYASTGGTGDHTNPSMVSLKLYGHDETTQFPRIDTSDPSTETGFLRALAYSTVVTGSPTKAPAIVRVGSTRSLRRNAAVALPPSHDPRLGSGRRLSVARTNASEETTPTQPLIRLNKAFPKLPKHFREVLILPILQSEPFPADQATSVVESLTKDEILARIQWIYTSVVDTGTTTAQPATSIIGGRPETTGGTPIPLTRHLWKSWSSEQFVTFIHGLFIEKFGSDVAIGEREFVRFFASIQLLFSGLAAVLSPSSGGSGSSLAMDKINFFTRMTQLINLEAPDQIMKNRVPAQLFPVFFYCMYVLQQVVVTRKHIEEAGLSIDVWTVPPTSDNSDTGTASKPSSRSRARSAALPTFRSHAIHAGQFVLLESVKSLLLYLLEATSPDAITVIDDRIKFLTDRAIPAKVALLSPIIPGAYELSPPPVHAFSSRASILSLPHAVPNGELTDVLILPLDFVVLTIANTWLQQHLALVDRLSVAMRAARLDAASGEMSFDEFTHVMLVGAAAAPSSTAGSTIRTGQLTQIYASLLAREEGTTRSRTSRATVKWQDLIVAVADEIDLLGLTERLQVLDLRSIQHCVLRGGSRSPGVASPWVARPSYRGGDTAALRRTWDANHAAMREHFALAFQSDNTLDGISQWQTGMERLDRVERLLSGSPRRKTTSPTKPAETGSEQLPPDELAVAWRALYYLQLDHAQAVHTADHVRTKQLRGHNTHRS